MRPALRLLASPSTAGATLTAAGLKPAPMAILPPIPLYRRILRAHRNFLPSDMRLMGDEYVKAEFRRHKEIDNPIHIVCCNDVEVEKLGARRKELMLTDTLSYE